MKVNKILLSGFRGSTKTIELNFDTSKSISLIFGENGTGKSTVVDGFDFICNKNYGSLGNYSIGKNVIKFVPAFGKKDKDCTVELKSENNFWKASLNKSTISVSPDANIPDARILRRQSILKLIEQEPKKRFDELKSFINVPNTEKTENIFRDAIKDTENFFNEYSRALSQAKDALESLWNAGGKIGTSSLQWAKEQVTVDISNSKSQIETLSEIEKKINEVNTELELLKKSITNETEAIKKQNDAKQQQENFEKKQKDKDSELLTLLQKAQNYVNGHLDKCFCPICETEQNIQTLLQRLEKRIAEMAEVKSFSAVTQQAQQIVESQTTIRKNAESQFVSKFKKLCDYFSSISIDIKSLFNFNQPVVQHTADTSKNIEELITSFSLWYTTYEKSQKAIVIGKKEELQNIITLQSTIQNHLKVVNEKESQAIAKEKLLKELRDIHQVIEMERKSYVEGILKSISSDVESLYSFIHPDEKIGKARFYLKPNAIGSLEFDASFQGTEEIPPQAYYSESHLDTLGICVFIALSKYFKTESTILLLDDVLTSVDAQHLDRFMSMLHDQSKIFNQIIITTHYRPWKDRYRHARSAVSNVDVIELGPWSFQNGIQSNQFITAIEELKIALSKNPFDRQNVASKSGIILESMLDFITIKYRCSLPRNPRNEYTLGDLVGGIDSKLSKLLKIKKNGSEIEIKPKLDEVINAQWIRNCVGCHFNFKGSEVTDQEVKKFADSVIEITDLLICLEPKCRKLPTKNKSGSYWECTCGKLELYPLTQPGADTRSVDDGE